MDTQFYGFPVHWRGCVKVADDMIGEPFDPDREREHEDPAALAKLRAFLSRHMPDLRDRGSRLQQDLHVFDDPGLRLHHRPGTEPRQCAVAAGFSGHGFKFGILIGQILADLATHGTTRWDLTRFRLDRTASAVGQHW